MSKSNRKGISSNEKTLRVKQAAVKRPVVKRPYASPEIVEYGALEELTQSGGSFLEGESGMGKIMN